MTGYAYPKVNWFFGMAVRNDGTVEYLDLREKWCRKCGFTGTITDGSWKHNRPGTDRTCPYVPQVVKKL